MSQDTALMEEVTDEEALEIFRMYDVNKTGTLAVDELGNPVQC